MRHKRVPFSSAVLVFSAALLSFPGLSPAGHEGQVAGVEDCYNCHTLDMNEADRGTSLISAASRTLPIIRSLSEGAAPDSFGCTYCHSNDLNSTRMKGVLTHFGVQTSKHPVGVNFVSDTETQNEYLSTWDSATAGELDCVDCHDPDLLVDQGKENLAGPAAYANHADPQGPERAGNPFMLLEPEAGAFCRRCHGSGETFAKADAAVQSHDDTTLLEDDGTPLKTSLCTDCHSSHYSSNFKLFNDGRRGGAPIVMGDEKHCATVCHVRGDAEGSYDLKGHGKKVGEKRGSTLGFGCGSCHSVNPRHDGNQPKMLNFREDGKVSRYGKSLTSVCFICHRPHKPHGGGKSPVGCLDCHDEHAEGSASNISMVPRQLPNNNGDAASAVYEKNSTDYYRADGQGLCDNSVCHSGVKTSGGQAVVPLSAFMSGGKHSGGDQKPGMDCRKCHSHSATDGSWSAE